MKKAGSFIIILFFTVYSAGPGYAADSGAGASGNNGINEKVLALVTQYNAVNTDYADKTDKILLALSGAIYSIVSNYSLDNEVEYKIYSLARDEYASKHFELYLANKAILHRNKFGKILFQTVDNITTGAFTDDKINCAFLSRFFPGIKWMDNNRDGNVQFEELENAATGNWIQFAGPGRVLTLEKAQAIKKENRILEFILPRNKSAGMNWEYIYLMPGDLLFTGAARKKDDTSGLLNAYTLGKIGKALGFDKMHVGMYIGNGMIIESGKNEENSQRLEVVKEDIYKSIFSTEILNGITTVPNLALEKRLLIVQNIGQYLGTEYDISHMQESKKLDCEELINIVFTQHNIFQKGNNIKTPDELFNATAILYNTR